MTRLPILIVAIAALALVAPRAEAQFSFMPYAGYDIERSEPLVGVGVEFGVLQGALPVGLVLRPSADYFFTTEFEEGGARFNEDLFVLNADLIARLSPPGGFGVYAGAGLGAAFSSIRNVITEVEDNSTELGLNLIGGVEFGGRGFITPFVQGRFTTLGDADRLALTGGVRFGL